MVRARFTPAVFLCLLIVFGGFCAWAQEQVTPGDLNRDAVTNSVDFFQFLQEFDPSGRRFSPEADCNSDDRIDHRDLSLAILGRRMQHGPPAPDPSETGIIEGVVREDAGDLTVEIPIAGAEVWVGTEHGFRMSTHSGPDGSFRFEGVPAGEVRVTAKHPDYHQRRVTVHLGAGETEFVILTLPRKREDLTDLSGFVRGQPDSGPPIPLEGAMVRVMPLGEGGPIGDFNVSHNPGEEDPHQVAITNEAGRYEIHDLPPGHYLMVVSARDHEAEERRIEIAEGDREHFEDFLLLPAVQRFGRVEGMVRSHHPLSMRPMDPPLAGAHVVLEPTLIDPSTGVVSDKHENEPDPNHRPRYEGVTDASGHYLIRGVLPGAYIAHAIARGHYPATATIEVASGQTTRQDFTLEVILVPTGAVAGTVTGITPGLENPVPLEDAVVHLVPRRNPQEPIPFHPDDLIAAARVRATTTDENGEYLFPEVPEGNYLVVATARGWGAATGAAAVIVDQTTIVDLLIIHRPPPPPASLSGHVFGASGVSDATGPLEGAHVLAIPARPEWDDSGIPVLKHDNPHPDRPVPPHFEAVTDASGLYEFPALPPGPYRIIALARGFQPGELRLELLPAVQHTADFVLRPLPSGPGIVMGTVFTHRPDQNMAVPVPGAHVKLIGADLPVPFPPDKHEGEEDPGFPPILIFETRTNEAGFFEFPRIPPGVYLLEVEKEGFHKSRQPVIVEPGSLNTINVELTPRPPMGETGSLEGRVFAAGGPNMDILPAPIGGALVIVIPLRGDEPPPMFENGVIETLDPGGEGCPFQFAYTRPDGSFEFDGIPVGPVAVIAVAEGFESGFARTRIEPGETSVLDLYLSPLGGGGGESSSLRGVVTGHSDDPTFAPILIEGAEVKLIRQGDPNEDKHENEPPDGQGDLVTRTDSDGRYDFPRVRPGLYLLKVKAEGYQRAEIPVPIPPNSDVRQDVELLPEGHEGTGTLFGFVSFAAPGVAGDEQAGTEGTNGLVPIAGATVRLVPDDMVVPAVFPPPNVGYDRITNERGFYEFRNIPAGGYSAYVFKEGFDTAFGHIDLPPGDELQRDWVLEPRGMGMGRIEGTVSEFAVFIPPGSIPIAGAKVTLVESDGDVRMRETDHDGRFAFGEVTPGTYTLTAEANGFLPETRHGHVAPDQVAHEDFLLLREEPGEGARLQGNVSEDVGPLDVWIPISGATVVLSPLFNEQPSRTTQTDSEGHYAFENVPPGEYEVDVQAEGYVPRGDHVFLPPGGNVTLNFQLLPVNAEAGVVEGALTVELPELGMQPAPGLEVRLRRLDSDMQENAVRSTRSNLEGRYRFDNVPPGRYRVIVVLPFGEPLRETVEVQVGETVIQDFVIPFAPVLVESP